MPSLLAIAFLLAPEVLPAVMSAHLRTARQNAPQEDTTLDPTEQVLVRRLESGGGDRGWWSGTDDVEVLPEDIFGLRSSYDDSSSYSYEFSYYGDTSLDDWEEGSSYDFSGDFSSDWFDDDGDDDFAKSSNFVGCYGMARIDSAQAYGFSHQEMTIEMCYTHCASMETTFMALEAGHRCWCGIGEQHEYTQHGFGVCDTPCAGDEYMLCGGAFAYDLYKLDLDRASTPSPVVDAPTSSPVAPPSTTLSGSTCDGGISGVQTGDACCVAGCGTCGGPGCSTRGAPFLSAIDCCVTVITESGVLCDVAGFAPCVIADGDEAYPSTFPTSLPSATPSPTAVDPATTSTPLLTSEAPLTPPTPAITISTVTSSSIAEGDDAYPLATPSPTAADLVATPTPFPTTEAPLTLRTLAPAIVATAWPTIMENTVSVPLPTPSGLFSSEFSHELFDFDFGKLCLHVGCFEDDQQNLAFESGLSYQEMTTEVCYVNCAVKGARFMGLEAGYQCWCGFDDQETYVQNGVGMCDSPCIGDEDTMCGGAMAFDLYRINPPRASTPSPVEVATVRPTSTSVSDTPAPMASSTPSPMAVATVSPTPRPQLRTISPTTTATVSPTSKPQPGTVSPITVATVRPTSMPQLDTPSPTTSGTPLPRTLESPSPMTVATVRPTSGPQLRTPSPMTIATTSPTSRSQPETLSPITVAPVSRTSSPEPGQHSTTCTGGIPGVQAEDSCCVAACGTCGGSGCSTRGAPSLGAADCCASEITNAGILCEVAGVAPCVVADGGEATEAPMPLATPAPAIFATSSPTIATTATHAPTVDDLWYDDSSSVFSYEYSYEPFDDDVGEVGPFSSPSPLPFTATPVLPTEAPATLSTPTPSATAAPSQTTTMPSASPTAQQVVRPTPSPLVPPTAQPITTLTQTPATPPSTRPIIPLTRSPLAQPDVPPTASPMMPPTTQPVMPSTRSPSASPTAQPATPPTPTPVVLRTAQPVAPPTLPPAPSPLVPPTAQPITPLTHTPATPPSTQPIIPPTRSPLAQPDVPPTASPMTPPTTQPVMPSTRSPSASPTAQPATPPTPTPVVSPTAQPVASPTPSPVIPSPPTSTTPAGMVTLVDLHNEARCKHNADPLTYSTEVETSAKKHTQVLMASCGQMFHSEREDRNNYGENLYMCWGSSPCYTAERAMDRLYDSEIDGDSSVTEYGGHATQILWKSTTKLGCAVDSCTANGLQYTVLVCQYNPAGNYMPVVEDQVELPSGASC